MAQVGEYGLDEAFRGEHAFTLVEQESLTLDLLSGSKWVRLYTIFDQVTANEAHDRFAYYRD